MKRILKLLIKLIAGYLVCAFGIVMTINANLGLAPWDVFHQGLANTVGITIGKAYIITGITILVVDIILGQKIGWGTVFNMLCIGIFVDMFMMSSIIPKFDKFLFKFLLMIVGLFIFGFGCYLYISTGLGSGPRDGLMIALVKKTDKSVRFVKNTQELLAVAAGYILGGTVGIGTLVMAILGGYFMQCIFKIRGFNVKEVKHRFIGDDIEFIKEWLSKKEIG